MKTKQFCPICKMEVQPSTRYPHYLCSSCARSPVDEDGKELEFFNDSISGGFIARYKDTKGIRDSHICFIQGIKCRADEAHLGGIVIQPAETL